MIYKISKKYSFSSEIKKQQLVTFLPNLKLTNSTFYLNLTQTGNRNLKPLIVNRDPKPITGYRTPSATNCKPN